MSQPDRHPYRPARDPGRAVRRRLFARRHPWLAGAGAVLAWLWLILIYGGCALGLAFMAATWQPLTLPPDRYLAPTIIYSSDGEVLAKLADEYRIPVTLDQVPPDTIHAILAAEDTHFYEHRGLDWRGILRALWIDVRSGAVVQGGSTLTQQLVRYELLDDERTLGRKINEAILAVRVERGQTKDQILERYLNAVYFGNGAYGLGAAAQRYFGKTVSDLTPAESALLAGIIREPGQGDPRMNLPVALRRQRAILAEMHQQGWLDDARYRAALAAPVALAPPHVEGWRAPYVVEAVRQELIARFGRDQVYQGGLTVYTTINAKMQAAAETALRDAVRAGRGQRVGNGALIAIDPETGYIQAMVGGVDFWTSQFNRATQAERQPGSAFKTFVYLAALNHGHLLSETALDAPVAVGGWEPENYGGSYHGTVTLEQALALSLNSVAVRLVQEVGPYAVIEAAREAGITSKLGTDLSLALGAYEVTPLEMASAFATLANNGNYIPPSLIGDIEQGGRTVLHAVPASQQRVPAASAFLLTQGLEHVITDGTGRRADIGRPAAGKTGTSNDYRDAWFVGYTPTLATAVWMGNDDHSPMAGVAGGSYPAQAWAAFMRQALATTPARDFQVPGGITPVTLCADSGKLALPTCPHPVTRYLPTGQVPTEYCDLHAGQSYAVCTETGLLPNATCPTEVRQFAPGTAPTRVCPITHQTAAPPSSTDPLEVFWRWINQGRR